MQGDAARLQIDPSTLVVGARDGDTECWDALVARFAPLVWTVIRSFGLSDADAAEASQTVWLRLTEHLDRITRPERLSAWLVTTARRESVRLLRLRQREHPVAHELEHHLADAPSADEFVLRDERNATVRRAFNELPEQSRTLLVMLLVDPPMSYRDISEALAIPVGSIGPTRARVLASLRKRVEAGDVAAGD